jgi:hypothetical protein
VQKLEAKRLGSANTIYGATVVKVDNLESLLGSAFRGYGNVVVNKVNVADLKVGDLVAYYSATDNENQTSQVVFARIVSQRVVDNERIFHMSDMSDNFDYSKGEYIIGRYTEMNRAAIFVLDSFTSDLGVALICLLPLMVIMIIQIAAFVAVSKEDDTVTSTELVLYDMNQSALVFDDEWEPGKQEGPTLALQSAEQARREQVKKQYEEAAKRNAAGGAPQTGAPQRPQGPQKPK